MNPPWNLPPSGPHSLDDNNLDGQSGGLATHQSTDSNQCILPSSTLFPNSYPPLTSPDAAMGASLATPSPHPAPHFGTTRTLHPRPSRSTGIGSWSPTSLNLGASYRVTKDRGRRTTTRLGSATVSRLHVSASSHNPGTQVCADEIGKSLSGGHLLVQPEMGIEDSYDQGFISPVATQVITSETAPPLSKWDALNSWFLFPAELRNQIYEYTLQMPTCQDLYAEYYKEIHTYHGRRLQNRRGNHAAQDDEPFPVHKANWRTPSILLVSHAITAECLSVLRSHTFTVDHIPPWLPGAARPMRISSFVGRRTLQNLRHIDLRLDLGRGPHGSAWIWVWLVEDLLDILAESSKLVSMRLVSKLFQTGNLRLWSGADGELCWYSRLFEKVRWFVENHTQIWSPPSISMETWEIEGDHVFLMAGPTRVAKLGTLPNPDLVPGSITDFIQT